MSSLETQKETAFAYGGGSNGTRDKLSRLNPLPQIDNHIVFYEYIVVNDADVPQPALALDERGHFVDRTYTLPDGWRVLNHKYFVDDEMMEESLTTFIKHFHSPFDDVQEAARCAREAKPRTKYFGKTADEILQIWQDRRVRGQQLHEYLELFYNDCHDPNDTRARDRSFAHFLAYQEEVVKKNDLVPFRTELRNFDVYDDDDLVVGGGGGGRAASEPVRRRRNKRKLMCGTADMIYIRRQDIGHADRGLNVVVFDWKFLNKMWTTGREGVNMFAPFDDMPDCNLYHYYVQLNGYRYMLEKRTPLFVTDMYVVDFGEDNAAYQMYQVPDMQVKIRIAIQMRREQHLREFLQQRKWSFEKAMVDAKYLAKNLPVEEGVVGAATPKRLRETAESLLVSLSAIREFDDDLEPLIGELRTKQRRTLHKAVDGTIQTNIADFFLPSKQKK